jgi:hypothetical protein
VVFSLQVSAPKTHCVFPLFPIIATSSNNVILLKLHTVATPSITNKKTFTYDVSIITLCINVTLKIMNNFIGFQTDGNIENVRCDVVRRWSWERTILCNNNAGL